MRFSITIVLTLASLAMSSPLSYANYEAISEAVASFDHTRYGKSTPPGEIVVAEITKWRYKHQGLGISDIFISFVSHLLSCLLVMLWFESNYTGLMKQMKFQRPIMGSNHYPKAQLIPTRAMNSYTLAQLAWTCCWGGISEVHEETARRPIWLPLYEGPGCTSSRAR